MENVLIILQKTVYLLLLIASGIIARKAGLLTDQGEKDLSTLLVDFFWPALILYQITHNLSAETILANVALPALAMVTGITGLLLGLLVVRLRGYRKDRGGMFLYHCMINNFVFMVLPFAEYYFPQEGAGLLFVHNLGMIVLIWTLGVFVLEGTFDWRESLRHLLTPGLLATVAGIGLVLGGLNRLIPQLGFDLLSTLGAPTVPVAMLVVGSRIYKLGRGALRFDEWNCLLGLWRLIVIPGVLLLIALLLGRYFEFSRQTLVLFMLVNVMPVSVNSVSLALRFKSDPSLAAQGVVFTHLFALLTLPVSVLLIEHFLL
jgi:predicted permease